MSTFNTTYTRRDVSSIYEYLKEQAALLSNGAWTDFSSGDIGSVLLGLMAYLADQNNFQLDKTACELFLDTAIERSSLIALLKLVGYEPRHYESAKITLTLDSIENSEASTIIPAYTTFTNQAGNIVYTTLENIYLSYGHGSGEAYEGQRISKTFTYNDIDQTGKIYLDDYKIGMNTIQLYIPSVSRDLIKKVPNVKFTDGEVCFSAHVSEEARIYIQLPSFWADIVSESTLISVSYLLCNGEAGRVGADLINTCTSQSIDSTYTITNTQSTGGYFPETVVDIKNHAPANVRTMYTIVTKSDLKQLVESNITDIASCLAGDYNDEWTGYTQPDDAYKCKVLAVPGNINEVSIFVKDDNGYFEFTNPDGTVYWYNSDNNLLYNSDYSESETPEYASSDTVSIFSRDSHGYEEYKDNQNNVYWYDAEHSVLYKEVGTEYVVDSETDISTLIPVYIKLFVSYTITGQELVDFVDERRLSSLMVTYADAKRITPSIILNIYTNPNDLRTGTIATSVFTFMTQYYDRETLGIGKSLYGSTIGRDLLDNFDAITYVEVVNPDTNISCGPDEYIDMYYSTYTIYVNDVPVIVEQTNTLS